MSSDPQEQESTSLERQPSGSSFRPAKASDAAKVAELVKAAYGHYVARSECCLGKRNRRSVARTSGCSHQWTSALVAGGDAEAYQVRGVPDQA